jgi:DNA-binding PucR family transcriptional regulator
VLLALGTSQPGIDGFRVSHEQALEARRVAGLAGRRAGSVTRYHAVALAALATANLAQARTFVAARLGALGGDDDVALRLAATLRVYLDENASPTRTAKRLGIHENTVANRVRQAEKLLGHSIGEQRLELHVALALAPLVR